jgi:hypothetical protein
MMQFSSPFTVGSPWDDFFVVPAGWLDAFLKQYNVLSV